MTSEAYRHQAAALHKAADSHMDAALEASLANDPVARQAYIQQGLALKVAALSVEQAAIAIERQERTALPSYRLEAADIAGYLAGSLVHD